MSTCVCGSCRMNICRVRLLKLLLLLGLWTLIVILLRSYVRLQNKLIEKSESKAKAALFKQLQDEVKVPPARARVPQPTIEWCLPLHYLPDPVTRPVTALASAPGSGNTWLRYLLQQASGVYTGSIYNDYDLKRKGFLAESVRDGSVGVVKLHEWGTKTLTLYQRAVLLIRSPGPAILAEFNRQHGGHTGHANPVSFGRNNGQYWENFVDRHLRDWQALNVAWLRNFTGPLHVVRYETLLDNLEPTLRALLQFLDLPVDDEALQCTLTRPEGAHKRHPRGYTFDPFIPSIKKKLAFVENIVLEELEKHQIKNNRGTGS